MSEGAVAYAAAAARTLSYVATALILGASTVGLFLYGHGTPHRRHGRLRSIGLAGSLGLLGAQAAKLWGQAAAFVDPGIAIQAGDFATIAFKTSWGRHWQVQCLCGAIALATFLAPGHTRAWTILRAATAGLLAFAIPLTGHAAAHPSELVSALGSQGLHVLAGGVWFGSLTTLVAAAVDDTPVWQRFSNTAKVCAPLVILTGLFRVYQNIAGLSDLWETGWGRTVLIKATLVLLAGAVGFLNWRVWLPGAARQGQITVSLRRAALLELTFAAAVYIVTGWLAGMPRRMG